MFESDCWLDWDPDPERAAREADPSLEPFASMTKAQILDLMTRAKGGREWEFLQEFFLNKCTPEELAVGPDDFIREQYGVFGFEELCYLEGAIELALSRRVRLQSEVDQPGAHPSDHGYANRVPGPFVPINPLSVFDKSGPIG